MKNNLAKVSVVALALALARAALAESSLTSVSVGPQAPSSITSGGTANYTVTITRSGSGSMDVYLTCMNLPAGATASFSPNPVAFSGNVPTSRTSTLVISTTTNVAAGSYPFVITARVGGSHNMETCTGTLIVGSDGKTSLSSHTITAINVQPNGSASISLKAAPNKPYILQATTSLNPTSWTSIATNTTDATGICVFMDLDAANYSARFYRTAVSN